MVKLAIVGRPNVGKSTLFNRLAGRKLAIVDDRPGVTRDRRFGTGRLGDLDLELIDTAGFEDVTDESLEARMRRQTELALDEADVALFVIDAREGVTPLDQVFAELLRQRDKPVMLVANKAEGKAGDAGALEAFALGFGEPVPISAEHGEGMSDLFAAVDAVAADPRDDADDAERGDKPVQHRHRRAAERRQVDPGQPADRRGPDADRPRGRHHPRRHLGGLGLGRPAGPAGRHRRACGARRRCSEKLEKLSTHDTIRAITFAEVVILVMDATHPFETQDLQIADLVEREGRGAGLRAGQVGPGRGPQARLQELMRGGRRAHAAAAAGRADGGAVGRDRARPRPADAGGGQGARRLVDQGQDPRPQRLAAHGHRAPPAAGGERAAGQAEVHGPDQGPAADLRAVRQPRRPAARQLPPLSDQLDPRRASICRARRSA